jgi:hypothetical protein
MARSRHRLRLCGWQRRRGHRGIRKQRCGPETGRHCVWEIRYVEFQRQGIHLSEINLRLRLHRVQSAGRSLPYLRKLRIIVETNVEIIVIAGIHGDFICDAFEEVVSANPA